MCLELSQSMLNLLCPKWMQHLWAKIMVWFVISSKLTWTHFHRRRFILCENRVHTCRNQVFINLEQYKKSKSYVKSNDKTETRICNGNKVFRSNLKVRRHFQQMSHLKYSSHQYKMKTTHNHLHEWFNISPINQPHSHHLERASSMRV